MKKVPFFFFQCKKLNLILVSFLSFNSCGTLSVLLAFAWLSSHTEDIHA